MLNSDMPRGLQGLGRRAALATAAFLVLGLSYLISDASSEVTVSRLLSLGIVVTTFLLIVFRSIRADGRIGLDIAHPTSLYGFFYFLYYLFPYLILFLTSQLLEGQELVIASLLCVGYLAWLIGSVALQSAPAHIDTDWIDRTMAQALLIVCIFGIALVAYFYSWRISEGNFYNQARFTEGELTIVDSIRSVLGQQLQLPIILLLGLLSAVRQMDIARLSRRILITYGVGISLVMVLSSQTRLAITAMIFLFIATRFYRRGAMMLWHVAIVGVLSLLAIVVIQALRIVSAEEFADAPNQLLFAIQNALPDALSAVSGHREYLEETVISRGGGAIAFLGEVVKATDDGGGPQYGMGILSALFSLVPRFVWLDKSDVMSPQLVAQELLGFPLLYDAPFGPVTQFYFEGGWLGVMCGFLLFGCAMTWLTSRTIRNQSIGMWIALSFVWSHVANLELELVVGVLGALRNGIFIYVLWRLLVLFISSARQSSAEPVPRATSRRGSPPSTL